MPLILITCFLICPLCIYGQQYSYEPSPEHPFGLPNPEAPKEILDWSELIGECDCQSVTRNPDQSWADTVSMVWRFKYILNGWGVQDETLKEDGLYAGSIRQFNIDSSHWYVHFYSYPGVSPNLSSWEGNRQDSGRIILYRKQKAPNGMDGFYKITFSDITDEGFNWLGAWVNPDESIIYPTWKINCKKRSSVTDAARKEILGNIETFSAAYVNEDYDAMANAYTADGMIMPGGAGIIKGFEAIKERWVLKDGSQILSHKVHPEEIKFIGSDHAYDYGYYEVKTKFKNGNISDWKGKYVILWKKEDGQWKMFIDIWNRVINP
ncbi:MAG: DUF4440 domain-containing protein [Bacteroidia bacterium]|nr:DUF4440 domain-containing protein [Bacteroidia bacterium]